MRVLQGDEPQNRSDRFAWRSRTYSRRAGARRLPAARQPTIQGRLVDPGLSREPLVCSRADPAIGARKNTALQRNLSRSVSIPVEMASPVSGHLIITTPILISCNLLCGQGTLP